MPLSCQVPACCGQVNAGLNSPGTGTSQPVASLKNSGMTSHPSSELGAGVAVGIAGICGAAVSICTCVWLVMCVWCGLHVCVCHVEAAVDRNYVFDCASTVSNKTGSLNHTQSSQLGLVPSTRALQGPVFALRG